MKKTWTPIILLAVILVLAWLTSSTALEIAATATGLLCVWLTARENIWAWPISMINVALFFYTFWEVKLYADMTLQIFFFILSIYGWVVWLTRRGTADVRPTRRLRPWGILPLALFLVAASGGWGYVLERYTDASIPYVDAFIATLSIVAQILLSAKILENWIIWIVIDVLSVGMYAYKGLDMIALLYLIYLGIAISGLVTWRRNYRADQAKAAKDTESAAPQPGTMNGAVEG
ncbi:nicotinamide riboside transporter PnuC [Paenibacillus lutrae]|uniref:Nicotinamide riboside transporter PnuC n=1 Tax=Paenibacillus lutrae TaxID=2078573 RepID=A0A7X3K197_9BACL|nr:nicotinamide riboside transporter PnuC [Paenibacillus lutrae]MVP01927.1 nicotinamide riboside transporter PnuC [Paenibacillus lutrae]